MNQGADVARRIFTDYYVNNRWGGTESRSGKGSSLDRGLFLAERLPRLMASLRARSLLDVPCGDVHWMSRFPLGGCRYTGVDIVPEMIVENRRKYGNMGEFFCLDACREPLPDADLVFCRDLLTHLPNASIQRFLENICRTGAIWFLCGRYLGPMGPLGVNADVEFGGFRSVDLCEAPFHLPAPILMVPEFVHKWKTMSLWCLDSVRSAIVR